MELFKSARTKLKYPSTYDSQSNRQIEVVNRCLETYLRCFSGTKLSWANYWFNPNYNNSVKLTLFKAIYGRDPPTIIRGEETSSNVQEVNALLLERNLMLNELKFHLEQAEYKMKKYANQKRVEVSYEVGDMVYLKIQPYTLKSLAARANQKLSPRYRLWSF